MGSEMCIRDRLKKVYGETYDPFSKWESGEGAAILPDGKGSMYVKVPMLGRWLGYKDSPLDLRVCADGDKIYFMQNGTRSNFDDAKGDRLVLSDGKRSAKFQRVSPP